MKKSLSIVTLNLMILILGITSVYGQGVRAVVIDPTNPMKINIGTYWDGVFRHLQGGDPFSSQEPWYGYNTGLYTPYLVNVLSMAIDQDNPNIMYIGTFGMGIYKTENGGQSWDPINTGLIPPASYVYALAIDPSNPSNIFAGTGNGVYKSMNFGTTWLYVLDTTAQADVLALAIDPSNSTKIYAGTNGLMNGHKIFKSDNSGATWFPADQNLDCPWIYDIEVDPDDSNTIYAGTAFGVYKSVNSGNYWDRVLPVSNVYSVAIDSKKPNYIFAGTYSDGVFKSSNRGNNWGNVTSILYVYDLAIDWNNPFKMFAATGDGLFKSNDRGNPNSWFQVY